MNSVASQRGLSLIELMVGITLAAILMALAMPSFVVGMQNRQIRSAAETVQAGLQFARSEALRRNRVVRFQMGAGTSWTVGCDPADATVDAVTNEVACPAVLQTRDANEGTARAAITTQELVASTMAEASTPVFTGSIRFTPLGRVTTDTLAAGNIAVLQVSNPTTGACAAAGGEMRCLAIRVTSNGLVRMCDPALAVATDARAC